MKCILTILIAVSGLTVFAQEVKILGKSPLEKLPPVKKFTFIEPATDTTGFMYVATLQTSDRIRNANIETLYFAIREKANELGANCYKLIAYTTDSVKAEVALILDAFFASDSLIAVNRSNHEKNVVYIFGNEKADSKPIAFKLNGESREIKPGTYCKIQLKEGEKTVINKGGMTGASVFLNHQVDKLPGFYTLSGFGLSSLDRQPVNGISFKTGGINQIGNISLGLLMVKLLKPAY